MPHYSIICLIYIEVEVVRSFETHQRIVQVIQSYTSTNTIQRTPEVARR
jgi:hypothetical protein